MADHAGRHFSNSLIRMLLEVAEQRLGADSVVELLAAAGETRPMAELCDDAAWSSYDQFVAVLRAASAAMGGPESLESIHVDAPLVTSTGSTTEMVALVHQLGSPIQLIRSMGTSSQFTIMEIHNTELGDASYRCSFRTAEGFEMVPELCAYMRGIVPLGVRVFGYDDITVEPVSCCVHGDEWCSVTVSWDDTRDAEFLLEEARLQRHVAEQRLAAFHETIADIVSVDDLDAVLDRIVASASRAMASSAHILEVDGLPGCTRHYTRGVSPAEARSIAERLDEDDPDYLVVQVASSVRHYGRLIVADSSRGAQFERPAVESYARLAATALDAAVALEESRREARTTAAMLELASSLAELGTAAEVAAKIAHAIPALIDCDGSAVLLRRDGALEVVARLSFDGETAGIARDAPIDAYEHLIRGVIVRRLDDMTPGAREVADEQGIVAIATAPILLDDVVSGLLVAGVRSAPERLEDDPHLPERFTGLAAQASIALRNALLVDQIRHQSLHDPLTDLPNRALILDRAEQMIARSARSKRPCAAFFIDLDGFKEVNDTQGHEAGDHVLKAVADRLRAAVRESDTVGRLGGDEFVVLADGASLDAGVDVVAERLLDILREPFELAIAEQPFAVRASIGVALGDGHSATELLHDADIALYSAKGAGKSCYRVFAAEMADAARARAELAEALDVALAGDELFLVYQPIVGLGGEEATGVEALLRWNHPTAGVLMPADFIPHLEESGQIVDVGRWVLGQACRQMAGWHAAGHHIDVSVNASIRQVERPAFVEDVRDALLGSGLDPASLVVEITESAIMTDAETTARVLRELRSLGVRIAIDDFGTGYSSLALLRQFPVDALKIDRSFIAGLTDSRAAGELVRTLVRLGKALGLETCAEGIEQPEQLARLRDEGCDSGQGYLFARPLAADAVLAFLADHSAAAVTTF
jgi:diguanylate cyclase (GGDEF)-like protein